MALSKGISSNRTFFHPSASPGISLSNRLHNVCSHSVNHKATGKSTWSFPKGSDKSEASSIIPMKMADARKNITVKRSECAVPKL
mmetsp:Transcript_11326/g.17046  ORF Transcript_11326/g.17046 Transcript_11326/m.17046 type:complete len:85 (-) Transcript_11326:75-329(-)